MRRARQPNVQPGGMPGSVCRAAQPALIRINRPRRIDRRGARRAHAFTPRCHRGPAAATPCVERSRDDARRGPRAGPPSGVPSSGVRTRRRRRRRCNAWPSGCSLTKVLLHGGSVVGMLDCRSHPPPGLRRRNARSSGCLLAEALHRRGAAAGMPDHRDARSPGCALSGILGRRVTPPPEYCVALRAAPSERREARRPPHRDRGGHRPESRTATLPPIPPIPPITRDHPLPAAHRPSTAARRMSPASGGRPRTGLTIVNNPPPSAFKLAMRRSPAYAVPIRCASDTIRCVAANARPPPSEPRFATAGVSVPETPEGRRPRANGPPTAARAAHAACATTAAMMRPHTPARRSDAVRVARSAT